MGNSKSFNKQLEKLNKNALKVLLDEIGLKKKYYDVLCKRYVEESDYYDIAEELNYTLESARNLVSKGKKELETIVNEQSDLLDGKAKDIAEYLKK